MPVLELAALLLLVPGPPLVVVVETVGVPLLEVEAPVLLLAAPVVLVVVLPVVGVPVLVFPFTVASPPESSLQAQAKHTATNTGKYRDLSM